MPSEIRGLDVRWRAVAGPPEYARILVDGNELIEIARVYRGNNTTQAEAAAMRIVSDHNSIIGIIEAARRIT